MNWKETLNADFGYIVLLLAVFVSMMAVTCHVSIKLREAEEANNELKCRVDRLQDRVDYLADALSLEQGGQVMGILGMVSKKSIQAEIEKARVEERDRQRRYWQAKLREEIEKLRGEYELRYQAKDADIRMLESLIDQHEAKVREALDKEMTAKRIYMKAHEITTRIDMEYRRHMEGNARSMVAIKEIRDDADLFMRSLLPEKTI